MPQLKQPYSLEDLCLSYLAQNIDAFFGLDNQSPKNKQLKSPLVELPCVLKQELLCRLSTPTVLQLESLTDQNTRVLPKCVTDQLGDNVYLLLAARRCKGLTQLTVVNNRNDYSFTAHVAIKTFTSLYSLSFSSPCVGVEDTVLTYIGSSLHHLRYLDIVGVKFTETTPTSIRSLCPWGSHRGCPRLNTLKICYNSANYCFLNVMDLVWFIIDMDNISLISHPLFYEALKRISERKLIQPQSRSITHLHVPCSSVDLTEIEDTMAYYGRCLESLNMDYELDGPVEISALCGIVSKIHNLKHLCINMMPSQYCLDQCKNTLVSLVITKCEVQFKSSCMDHILRTFNSLEYLYIDTEDVQDREDDSSDEDDTSMAGRHDSHFINVTKLKKIFINYVKLNEPTLKTLLMSPALEFVNLELCEELNDELLSGIVSPPRQCNRANHEPGLRKLRTLRLVGCCDVTELSLCTLLNDSNSLQELIVYECLRVDTDELCDQVALLKCKNYDLTLISAEEDDSLYSNLTIDDFVPNTFV